MDPENTTIYPLGSNVKGESINSSIEYNTIGNFNLVKIKKDPDAGEEGSEFLSDSEFLPVTTKSDAETIQENQNQLANKSYTNIKCVHCSENFIKPELLRTHFLQIHPEEQISSFCDEIPFISRETQEEATMIASKVGGNKGTMTTNMAKPHPIVGSHEVSTEDRQHEDQSHKDSSRHLDSGSDEDVSHAKDTPETPAKKQRLVLHHGTLHYKRL